MASPRRHGMPMVNQNPISDTSTTTAAPAPSSPAYVSRAHLAYLRLHLSCGSRDRRPHRPRTGARGHHWLSGGGHRHRAVGAQARQQCAGHSSLRRIRRGADAVSGRTGTATQPPVEHAPPDLRAGHRADARLRGPALGRGLGAGHAMAHRSGGRTRPRAVVHRHRAAIYRRAQSDAHRQRPESVLDSAVPGRGGDPDSGAAAAARRRCRRDRRPHRSAPRPDADGVGSRQDHRRGRRHHHRRPPAAAPAAALDRQEQDARDLHRHFAVPRGQHRHADAHRRPVDGARCLPCGRAAGRQRIPPRT